jgi:hypothetical protein
MSHTLDKERETVMFLSPSGNLSHTSVSTIAIIVSHTVSKYSNR